MVQKKQKIDEVETLKKIWPFVKEYKKWVILTSIFLILESVLVLVTPYIYKLIADTLTNLATSEISIDDAFSSLLWISGIFLLASICLAASAFATNYFSEKFILRLKVDLRNKSILKLFSLEYSFYEDSGFGKIHQKVQKGIDDLIWVVRNSIYMVFPPLIQLIVLIPILLSVSWQIALITYICIPAYLFVNYKQGRFLRENENVIVLNEEKRVRVFHQIISNILLVKLFATEKPEEREYSKQVEKIRDFEWENAKIWRDFGLIKTLILSLNTVLIVLVGGYQAIHGIISVGDIVMVFGYITVLYSPLQEFSWLYNSINVMIVGINRVLKLMELEPKIKDAPDARELKIEKGGIEFRDVDFKYKNKWVFKSLNFKVEPGQTVALVGPSGVGKSTIAKLLARLYDVDKGEILIDGQDIKKVTQKSLRDKIGVVPQEDLIFDNTVRYNIAYGNSHISEEEVISAAKKAHADKFISRLPKGYDTLVGERGIRLSGGEKQRLAIARAILKNAPILVLDEATSSLDSQSEIYVQEGMKELIQNKTSLIIAHRLSTIMKADKILVFDKGKIVESGTHKELLKKKGLYYKLFNIQSGSFLVK